MKIIEPKQMNDFLGNRIEKIVEELKSIKEASGIDIKIDSNGNLGLSSWSWNSYSSNANKHSFMFDWWHNANGNHELKRCSSECRWCHCPVCKFEHGNECK